MPIASEAEPPVSRGVDVCRSRTFDACQLWVIAAGADAPEEAAPDFRWAAGEPPIVAIGTD
ncbi:MAG TPA: hypothetical protein VFL57_16830 [Bryobacteraceae bacterium]|nr:hypothetical protein [Bryobacteraceae bacterium]